jgi:transposase
VCPQTGQSVGLLSPSLNTGVVNAFFQQMAQEVDPQTHVVMFWDQAGFHTSKALKCPKNVTLIRLPPYSPELNPIENLWHYLRSHHWSNRAYGGYEDLEDAACEAWQKSCLDSKLMQSVCACPYLKRDSENS